MQEMISSTREKLLSLCRDLPRYQEVLSGLIVQSAFEFRSDKLVVIGLARDAAAIKASLPEAKAKYKKATNKDLEIIVGDKHLSEDEMGGILVHTVDNRIRSNNTFKAREESILQELLPRFRHLIFEE